MDHQFRDILEGREGNHLLPFLWMHDGHHDELPKFVQEVYDSGARALCVESRPHKKFCEEEWWADMDVVIEEARKRDMKVWILDDQHFPTGYANGIIPRKYPHLRKWQLIEEHMDVIGPLPEAGILLNHLENEENELIGIYAYRREQKEEVLTSEVIDLTDKLVGRQVFWDVPKGIYRVFAFYKSRLGTRQTDYIHLIDPESVHALIEEVYESHYAHYGQYFGNTIAGFFSDEPSFGNCEFNGHAVMPCGYERTLGIPGLALPWTDELWTLLNERYGGEAGKYLAGLWYEMEGACPEIRVDYMDIVTRLWQKHFSFQIGDWCRAHNVEYIGHVIEDQNAHARLGCSGGHYFRSLDGQDMAGIDVVLHQIIPGMAHFTHAAWLSGMVAESEFFDYVLARLAASHSHIQPNMKNRAMCEIFGAYGWAEDLPMMKHLMDHMLVRGINHFVPHAFSPKYPDPDCPPHFNAGGSNPQFGPFAELMRYTNRTCHLFEGGREIVSAAILYHAEAEWSGRDCMLVQKPARHLMDAQLNYDIVPIDAIMERGSGEGEGLRIGDMVYPVLIVPYAACLPEYFLEKLGKMIDNGLKCAFIDGRPDGFDKGEVITLSGTADYVRALGGDVTVSAEFDLLRFRHVVRDGNHVFMFVNESQMDSFEGDIILPVSGNGIRADLQMEKYSSLCIEEGRVHLELERGQSVFIIAGDDAACDFEPHAQIVRKTPFEPEWMLSKRRFDEKEYSEPAACPVLRSVTGIHGDPRFSGTMKYEARFTLETVPDTLDLGFVGQTARLYVNGEDLGYRYCLPYIYDVAKKLHVGENHIVVEIANTLANEVQDQFTHFIPMAASGLLGPVSFGYISAD
ncbi:MAG: hypothetical protein IKM02_00185 [Clostridia bacterium]|nr:hypothetical protein [Clostridia bacterium]